MLLRTLRAAYYACISFIDFGLGRIIEELEAEGELDNTLILFSADHGELLGDYGCVGKRSMLEASARVPLLARLPGRFEAGARVDVPATLLDVLPTCLGAANVAMPASNNRGEAFMGAIWRLWRTRMIGWCCRSFRRGRLVCIWRRRAIGSMFTARPTSASGSSICGAPIANRTIWRATRCLWANCDNCAANCSRACAKTAIARRSKPTVGEVWSSRITGKRRLWFVVSGRARFARTHRRARPRLRAQRHRRSERLI